jgi:hypothetical protein
MLLHVNLVGARVAALLGRRDTRYRAGELWGLRCRTLGSDSTEGRHAAVMASWARGRPPLPLLQVIVVAGSSCVRGKRRNDGVMRHRLC